MSRKNYTIVLEITPTAPLTHGAGVDGNESVMLTREYNVLTAENEWERIDIPAVSGAAMKATLREHSVMDGLERAGVQPGTVSKDALRLLLKGGKNDSGGASVSLAEGRRLRDLFPTLAVFGSMDGGLPMRGEISVSDVVPWVAELAAADQLPQRITPLQVAVEGQVVTGAAIEVYPGVPPMPAHLVRTSVTYYRHDLQSSGAVPYLQGAQVAQIEEAREGRAKAGSAKKEQRREANESMPHSMQAIAAGTPMVCTIRLTGASEVEFVALCVAITRWIASGGHLGGGATKGHGACRVRVAGALRHHPADGAIPADAGSLVTVQDPASSAYLEYDQHIRSRAETIRAYVAEATR